MPELHDKIFIYDTTLRDGSQRRDISYSLNDKIKITYLLDDLGVDYIEGGWPASNKTDQQYFEYFANLKNQGKNLKNSKIVAFGSTRKAFKSIEDDIQIKSLLASEADTITLVAKIWPLHVEQVLQTTLEENLEMIFDSVQYFKSHNKEVILDAEHFFDAWKSDQKYAMSCIDMAIRAGVDWIVLCDTNGGSLPEEVYNITAAVKSKCDVNLGIHAHNDMELAVANSLTAVSAGVSQIQGTINGYGERCGNANLVSIIPTLFYKLNMKCLDDKKITQLSLLSQQVSEISNVSQNQYAAYVGQAAFSHKGGIHVAAVEKISSSYEHIEPEFVGNKRQVILSELSGRSNVRIRAKDLGIDIKKDETMILETIKQLENRGLTLEGADGTFELALRRLQDDYVPPFKLLETQIHCDSKGSGHFQSQAIVKVEFFDKNKSGKSTLVHTIAESVGPVEAIDLALRKALEPIYPVLQGIQLTDYKVRILNPEKATSATTRVWIEASDSTNFWSTVGCSENILEASSFALADLFELYLLKHSNQINKLNNSNGREKNGNQAA